MALVQTENDMLEKNMQDDITDISFAEIRRKRFRIDGDNNKILELNVADMNIVPRLQEAYPKMVAFANEIAENTDAETKTEDTEELDILAEEIRGADVEIRKFLDYIFDAPVSQVCVGNSNVCDLHNGKFKFEIIIEKLAKLYAINIDAELKAIDNRIKERHAPKHSGRYTKKRK